MQLKQEEAPEDIFTTGGFSQLELRDSLKAAIEKLPDDLRAIVQLRYFDHLSYKEIAERLNIPVGTVNSILMDAFAGLFARLKDQIRSTPAAPNPESETQQNPPINRKIDDGEQA